MLHFGGKKKTKQNDFVCSVFLYFTIDFYVTFSRSIFGPKNPPSNNSMFFLCMCKTTLLPYSHSADLVSILYQYFLSKSRGNIRAILLFFKAKKNPKWMQSTNQICNVCMRPSGREASHIKWTHSSQLNNRQKLWPVTLCFNHMSIAVGHLLRVL